MPRRVFPHAKIVRCVDRCVGRGIGGAIGARITGYRSVVYEEGTSSLNHTVDQKIKGNAAFVIENVADLDDRAERG